MKVWTLAVLSLRRILRDRVTLFFTLLFPAMFVVVFGFAFRGSGSKQTTYAVAVVNHDVPITISANGKTDTLAFGRDIGAMLAAMVYADSGAITFDRAMYDSAKLHGPREGGAAKMSKRLAVFNVVDNLSDERAIAQAGVDSVHLAIVIPAGFSAAMGASMMQHTLERGLVGGFDYAQQRLAAAGRNRPISSDDIATLGSELGHEFSLGGNAAGTHALHLPSRDAAPVSVDLYASVDPDARIAAVMVQTMVAQFEGEVGDSAVAQMSAAMPVSLPSRPAQYITVTQKSVPGHRRTVFEWMLPGMLIFGLLGVQTGIAVELVRDQANGLLDRLRVTRMSAIDYNIGRLLPWIVMAAIQTLFLVGVGTLLGFRLHGSLLLTTAIGMLTVIATFASAYLIASFSRNERQASSMSTFISLGLSFYVGAFFDISSGKPFHLLGHAMTVRDFLPWAHMVKALRLVMLDNAGLPQIAWDLAWFAGLTGLLLIVAVGTFTRRRLSHE